ncbi:hypothetical protein HYH02_009586 [Chlamydomonas schloesseri]|uniref:Uncharacterized protein n=1 Tax=Chlamydomonas schloesseri TaxID=2026947 RepID=A0A835TE88_9CHLO|nr:hypothetical protein HYH02_009586 [Chlamydomonas schloesseri]|eukprot:KAG2442097.1 hypothetical protein HYH02_009586 [Chlamydomonas schloesseri]
MMCPRGVGGARVTGSAGRPVPLPPDSLLVLSPPAVYALPAEWLGDRQQGLIAWGCVQRKHWGPRGGRDAAAAGVGGGGGGAGGALAAAGASQGVGVVVSQGPLLPLVQVDQRLPYEAKLVAGTALFPIPVAQGQQQQQQQQAVSGAPQGGSA